MKLWNKFIDFWITGMPRFEKKVKADKINTDLKHLRTQTKSELEKLGRKVGVELDKRLTKEKLIKQIRKHSK